MGSCVSRQSMLNSYINSHILSYPGCKVYLSTIFIHWVWEKDSKEVLKYINEYDPMSLKYIYINTTKTLDTIARFRRSRGLPFLTRDETYRYNCLIRARSQGSIGGYTVVTGSSKYGIVEYLENCKFTG